MYHRILIAYDGSPDAEKALQAALCMAKENGAELHLVAVEEGLPRYAATADEIDAVKEQKDAYYQRLCVQAEAEAARAGLSIGTRVLPGHPSRVIPDLARQLGCDLIVVGFHGHSAVYDRIWGSTSRGVVFHSNCSVLIVK
jgi:nucleotide-binding universal stress UspA family protein